MKVDTTLKPSRSPLMLVGGILPSIVAAKQLPVINNRKTMKIRDMFFCLVFIHCMVLFND